MKHLLFLFSLSILLANCTVSKTERISIKPNPSDYYQSLKTKKIMPGKGLGLVQLEETRSKDLYNKTYTKDYYQQNGIEFQFRRGDTLTGIVVQNDGNYFLKNKNIGQRREDIIATFGKPKINNQSIVKGEKAIGSFESLNYEGVSIIFIDSTTSVISINSFIK
jgi:hypothetical protein